MRKNMKKRICVYTCITGNYDNLKEIENMESNIDYYCFTNNRSITSNTWNIVYIDNDALDNIRLARKIKILGHSLINKKYDIFVWVDAAIKIKKSINKFLDQKCDLNKYSLIMFKHRFRNCIYDEAIACIEQKRDDINLIKNQIELYKKEKYPEQNGLVETTVYVKKMNSKINKILSDWFYLVKNFSCRDQLSFNYVLWKNKTDFQLLNLNVFNNEYFFWTEHVRSLKEIENYRAFFGDSKNGIDISKIYDGKLKIKNEIYTANFKVLVDTDRIELELSKNVAVLFSVLEIKLNNKNNKKIKIDLYNSVNYNDKNIIVQPPFVIALNYNFIKNDKIMIKFDIKQLEIFEYSKIISNYLEKLDKKYQLLNAKLISENDFFKNELNKIYKSKGWKLLNVYRKIFKK